RSKAAPTLRMSAGARLTVMRSPGNGKPELRMAVRTRSRLSRTVASGRPTTVRPGSPGDTSTSTDTATGSMPTTAAAASRASMSASRAKSRPEAVLQDTLRKAGEIADTAHATLAGLQKLQAARVQESEDQRDDSAGSK